MADGAAALSSPQPAARPAAGETGAGSSVDPGDALASGKTRQEAPSAAVSDRGWGIVCRRRGVAERADAAAHPKLQFALDSFSACYADAIRRVGGGLFVARGVQENRQAK